MSGTCSMYGETQNIVRFQVLTVASMKCRVFWDVVPCSDEVDWRFRGVYCLASSRPWLITLMMEVVCTSETSVSSNMTTRRYIPEDSELHTKCWLENVKGRCQLEDFILILSRVILKKYLSSDVRLWTDFNWFRLGSIYGLLWTQS
jgi:hypothetical protein